MSTAITASRARHGPQLPSTQKKEILLVHGISDGHHTLQEFMASVGAEWTFLSQPDRTIQQDLDIQEYTGPSTTR